MQVSASSFKIWLERFPCGLILWWLGLLLCAWLWLVPVSSPTAKAEAAAKTVVDGLNASPQSFASRLAAAAMARTKHRVRYDGSYVRIDYPNGDVPADTGVCTDVVVRSYRALGVGLQRLVHEDMRANFSAYPSKRMWGLNKPDSNIDHRRVPNLQTFFSRHGVSLPVSDKASDYAVGDVVIWMLPGNLSHIGIVVDRESADGVPMVVHNIGAGPELSDVLFAYPITGHYRFVGLVGTSPSE